MSQPETGTELSTEAQPESVLAMIARAASDPNVNVEKMQALMTMQERVMDRSAKASYTRAFAAMSAQLPSITKRGGIANNSGVIQSRYAKWEDIHRVITPILREHGFALGFKLGEAPNKAMTVSAQLSHVDGHVEESGPMAVPIDATGNKNAVQGTGSAMSYGKRYTTIAMLNIVTEEDTDGASVSPEYANAAEKLWIEEAKEAASKGVAAYSAHFAGLSRAAKLYLVNSGEHEKLKSNAQGAGK